MSPPVIRVWTSNGNIPPYWLEYGPVPDGVRALSSGAGIETTFPSSASDERVGVTVYDTPNPTQSDVPWLVWADLPDGSTP